PARAVQRGEVRPPRHGLRGRPRADGAADPEARLAGREETLPTQALDRREMRALPGPLRALDVALAEGPVDGPHVITPRRVQDWMGPLRHAPGPLHVGLPGTHQRSSPTGLVPASRALNVRMSAWASGSPTAMRWATRSPSPTICVSPSAA